MEGPKLAVMPGLKLAQCAQNGFLKKICNIMIRFQSTRVTPHLMQAMGRITETRDLLP